jgi:hypothetical protein
LPAAVLRPTHAAAAVRVYDRPLPPQPPPPAVPPSNFQHYPGRQAATWLVFQQRRCFLPSSLPRSIYPPPCSSSGVLVTRSCAIVMPAARCLLSRTLPACPTGNAAAAAWCELPRTAVSYVSKVQEYCQRRRMPTMPEIEKSFCCPFAHYQNVAAAQGSNYALHFCCLNTHLLQSRAGGTCASSCCRFWHRYQNGIMLLPSPLPVACLSASIPAWMAVAQL